MIDLIAEHASKITAAVLGASAIWLSSWIWETNGRVQDLESRAAVEIAELDNHQQLPMHPAAIEDVVAIRATQQAILMRLDRMENKLDALIQAQ